MVTTLWTPVAAAVGSTAGFCSFCFDDGTTEGWTIDNTAGAGNGLWNVSNDRSVSPSFSLHYGTGTGGDYDTGGRNAGTVTSPSITLPGSGPMTLDFDIWREVETFASGTWDEFSVSILPAGSTIYAVSRDGGTGGAFQSISLDLSAFAGQTIQVVFNFDTGDGSFNDFEGIYVDDITLPCVGGGGAALRSFGADVVGEPWTPDRPEPTANEQRLRDRIIRREQFGRGEVEDTDLQSGIKQGQ